MNKCYIGDCRDSMKQMIAEGIKVNMCVTSPPYWGLRDYGAEGQFGLEALHDCAGWATGDPCGECHVCHMVDVFELVKELLTDDGTLWMNYGDSYCHGTGADRGPSTTEGGRVPASWSNRSQPQRIRPVGTIKTKDLCGMPWRVAFALQAAGWYLRQDIIWSKPNPMPESVTDRCTKAHEYIFLFSKSGKKNLWRAEDTREWSKNPDLTQRLLAPTPDEPHRTVARWRGFDYYFDADAIAEPLAYGSVERLSQPGLDQQPGSDRVPGKTNGRMKAVAKVPSNRGHDKPYDGKSTKDYASGGAQDASATKARIVDRILAGEIVTRNKRSVWTVTTKPFSGAHFATFPPDLIEPCILAGSKPGGLVLDPFMGSGTTAQVSQALGRQWVGCELNEEYVKLQDQRTAQQGMEF